MRLLNRIGTLPALVALFLYGLLPIVRNTATGMTEVARGYKQAGAALGLRDGAILRLIELPVASRTILAGVRTSAVINVGTATIAAFIGAGGYGERIVAGLAVNDNALLLAGAVPAALLAILIEGAFGLAESVPRTARAAPGRSPALGGAISEIRLRPRQNLPMAERLSKITLIASELIADLACLSHNGITSPRRHAVWGILSALFSQA